MKSAIDHLYSVSNFLRGMGLDPAIPKHAKEAIQAKVHEIETFLEKDDEP